MASLSRHALRCMRHIGVSGSRFEPWGLVSQNGTVPGGIGKETELNSLGSGLLLLFRNYSELAQKQSQHSIAVNLGISY